MHACSQVATSQVPQDVRILPPLALQCVAQCTIPEQRRATCAICNLPRLVAIQELNVLRSQKNVRLCRPDAAVRCAVHLLKEDPNELLRRSVIICLEDALLHPAVPLLAWLTAAAAKGYCLGCTAASAVLHVVHQLAAVPVRDYLHSGPVPGGFAATAALGALAAGTGAVASGTGAPAAAPNSKSQRGAPCGTSDGMGGGHPSQSAATLEGLTAGMPAGSQPLPATALDGNTQSSQLVQRSSIATAGDAPGSAQTAGVARNAAAGASMLSAAEASLIACLQLRASFGGMPGDMAMLRGYAALWTAR